MAITKIFPIDKTVTKGIDYISDDKKTDYGKYVTGLNCNPLFAEIEFDSVRRKFNKNIVSANNKHMAFHIVQSFEKSDKLDADTAHEIGITLAKDFIGDFQAVVATHTDKEYLHNHIIFNAVSYKDGRKYLDRNREKQILRDISDALCEEFGLGVLEKTKKFVVKKNKTRTDRNENTHLKNSDYRNSRQYSEWKSNRINNSEVIKRDVDLMIAKSDSYEEFISNLKNIGYKIKDEGVKHIAFKPPGAKKFRRGYILDESGKYTKEQIIERIAHEKGEKKDIEYDNYEKFENHQFSISFDREEVNRILYDARNQYTLYQKKEYKEFVDTIKDANRDLYSLYKSNPLYRYDEKSKLYAREQKILTRINNTVRSMHCFEKHNIEDIDSFIRLYIEKEKQLLELQSRVGKMKKEINTIQKKIHMIEIYENFKLGYDMKLLSEKEIEGMETTKQYLLKYDLLDESNIEKLYEDIKKYDNEYSEIADEYNSISKDFEELDVTALHYRSNNLYIEKLDQENIRKESVKEQKSNKKKRDYYEISH